MTHISLRPKEVTVQIVPLDLDSSRTQVIDLIEFTFKEQTTNAGSARPPGVE